MEVKTDCFAYNEEHKDCSALSDLYCKREECNFYKSKKETNKKKIEESVLKYSMKN